MYRQLESVEVGWMVQCKKESEKASHKVWVGAAVEFGTSFLSYKPFETLIFSGGGWLLQARSSTLRCPNDSDILRCGVVWCGGVGVLGLVWRSWAWYNAFSKQDSGNISITGHKRPRRLLHPARRTGTSATRRRLPDVPQCRQV